jgi:tRNA(Ile)-lysidine synthase
MLRKVRKTIADSSLLERGDHLLVAVSGGPDSVALLWTLVLLSREYELQLTTAHLNHGLRGEEAQAEERFVHSLCAGMGIRCISKRIDIRAVQKKKRRSLEDVGREERYRFLHETTEVCGAEKIATGHQRDDQAETVLINLLRGSGLEGLKGIVPVREDRIIRPLLHVARTEILEFLDREGLTYFTDSSNKSPRFLRNRIRHQLIPELSRLYNPGIVRGLSQTAEIVRREDDYLRMKVEQILHRWGVVPGRGEAAIPLADFVGMHAALQGRVVKRLLEEASREGNGVGYRHVEAVLALARSSRLHGASLDLPGLLRVAKEGKILRIGRVNARPVRRDKPKKMV